MTMVAARQRRPSHLAGIAIPPVSMQATTTTTTTTTHAAAPPTSPPWTAVSHSLNPFGDSNGRRDSFTTPYRRTSTSTSLSLSLAAHAAAAAAPAARPPLARSMTSASHLPRHAKLHKRSDSTSSAAPTVFTMPSPIQDEFTHALSSTTTANTSTQNARHSSANKIKPYLRKMSLRDDDLDQGRLDLSRPSAENESLTGIGICDDAPSFSRSTSDVSFIPSTRRKASHSRATSGPASLAVAASGPLRPTQPFAPLREAPRAFTPPATVSQGDTSDDEAEESVGVLTNDIRQPDYEPWKPRRSVSISSNPAITPLSQTYTAGSLTKLTSASQSNLSIRSQPSYDQLKSGRSTRNNGRGSDYPATPSARTSIDKAFSFITRTSEPEDAASRAAAIRAARRAFEEKEAAKDRKYEKEDVKRRASVIKKEERKWRKSDPRASMTSNGSNSIVVDEEKAVAGTDYATQTPAHDLSLPIQGDQSGAAPTVPISPPAPSKTKQAKGGWNRMLAWTRTRLLNCGGKA
ncbi:hypothetical protein AUEXF2481DRAFT_6459 [Aureobasidium subglaciale EXF-2481]|uniref:Uncharacterized protein n=1 Tax=Aureobasidium subglaciale (strain EXF-2481) TaxID=1043005 RepID=A0A074YIG7_AURSE|nr:uncharacterized protein AUEXF2481DRAFT_6459 [Aureobasidium subglaciale EXF-2481]KAI5208749.1 hypothetical protein E4T38_02718 [Aureobasidium subglaciale]KAI5227679.1 hypothetical protein E4T40_02457 [Aureobasidium subglaciale]KAI5230915.1 hypothetical protein E4T41_02717 [Aureobasidium subglaciale]KAI5265267.1 hypothetical protein E4T46_02495 [Aureobasidium subglaciale]KEQ93887.1 hypothetical protein AUEXF2481DRAFT_6459 [Aureobasidium subglaciale EXF-2481]